MKTAVAYARYSSTNQNDISITAQLRAIQEYAAKNKIQVLREYIDEAQSATTDDRTSFKAMIADLGRLKADLVLVHKVDRFARNRYDAAIYRREIQRVGARLLAVDQPLDDSPESALLESLLDGLAEYYSKNLAREVMKGLKENAYLGKHNGGRPPLGYDIAAEGKYVINEAEAQVVRLIFQRVLEGQGYGAIIQELNRLGFRTKRGRTFGKNSIHDLLRNEKYCGTYVYMKGSKKIHRGIRDDAIIAEDAIPAIISKEDWLKVQKIMDARKKGPRSRNKVDYLLTGKVYCGLCGAAFVGNSGSGKSRAKYYYYQCNQQMRKKDCSARPIRKETLEDMILDAIKNQVLAPESCESLAGKIAEYSRQREGKMAGLRDSMERQLAACEAKVDRIVEKLIEAESKLEEKSLRVKLRELEKQKNEMLTELALAKEKPQVSKEMALAYLEHIREELENHGPDTRPVIEQMVKKITVTLEQVEIELSFVQPDGNGVLIRMVALRRYRSYQNTIVEVEIT